MFMATHLIGFGARRASAAGRTLGSKISPTGLTKFGDMTLGSGLAAAFDANTNEASPACASNSANGYAGMTLTSAKRVYHMVTYGTNNAGYDGGGNPSVTLTLYGKQGSAPSSYSNGTSLGSTTFTDTDTTNSKTIVSTDQETLWDHLWLVIGGSATFPRLAEVEFYEAV